MISNVTEKWILKIKASAGANGGQGLGILIPIYLGRSNLLCICWPRITGREELEIKYTKSEVKTYYTAVIKDVFKVQLHSDRTHPFHFAVKPECFLPNIQCPVPFKSLS